MLGDDGDPVEPVESYLAYLAALERSPNTQRAYATSLKLWFEFLDRIDVGLGGGGASMMSARFVSWLRAPATNVVVLDGGTAARSPATVNRHLAAVFGFYEHHARSRCRGCGRAGGVAPRSAGVLQAVPASRHQGPAGRRPDRSKLAVPRRAPRTLRAERARCGAGRAASVPGTGSCWRCWPRPACGSVRRSGCATPIS